MLETRCASLERVLALPHRSSLEDNSKAIPKLNNHTNWLYGSTNDTEEKGINGLFHRNTGFLSQRYKDLDQLSTDSISETDAFTTIGANTSPKHFHVQRKMQFGELQDDTQKK